NQILVTGNTAIDALKDTVSEDYHNEILEEISEDHRIILVTMHRRENQGAPMQRVFKAIRQVVDETPDVEVIFPVHLNPKVQQMAEAELGNDARIKLVAPLDVLDFHNIAARSYLIMTDSGGVQEEAPSLG
ncbi:UDP-N-acetylglucosamine 2-epimerase, partial [Pediococcus acidilactici]|nr:UDP-N-acetylglucosamine 2-epimerase [Pediococcus acidilactici]